MKQSGYKPFIASGSVVIGYWLGETYVQKMLIMAAVMGFGYGVVWLRTMIIKRTMAS